ncbi:hypothetical protein BJ684DRAFT_21530 [Piptocephalis cylindrospora]|uniref:Uncharacterized protein n=1 Tax=Piptocephalis cylindrospora TaxID=1907219 RepID=A0A4P9XZH6_9FUNG|nr:hypothetical protein BJ684DRAFT_21530 [Piptocephalis cylindrospora]|eukprot:RKP11896.1 hypothetical protein BJ684DRAFT_21530 [Piptocephalis cylindrospora]
MDLELDPLLKDTEHAQLPYCRWTVNIRHCNDEFFFVITNWIAVVISIVSITLASMAIHRYTRRPEVYGWFITSSFSLTPPTPYWVRMLPYTLAWVAAFSGLYPYMMEIVKSSAILPQAQYGSTSVRMGQFWCCAAMVLVIISVGIQNVAEGMRDGGFPEVAANMLTGSFIMASVAGSMDAWVLWWYALRMAKMVKVKLAVEEASYRLAVETTLSRPILPSFREMMCREDRVADEQTNPAHDHSREPGFR